MARKKRSDGCTEQANHNKTRPWPDLPVPVVISIRKQLHLLKHVYFGGVCKNGELQQGSASNHDHFQNLNSPHNNATAQATC
ncbi:hypothetical protein ACOSQ3_030530 [Xanthoceras sorbifolium]